MPDLNLVNGGYVNPACLFLVILYLCSAPARGQFLEVIDGRATSNSCQIWAASSSSEVIDFKWTGRCGPSERDPGATSLTVGAGVLWTLNKRLSNVFIDYDKMDEDHTTVAYYRLVATGAVSTPTADAFNRCLAGSGDGKAQGISFKEINCKNLPRGLIAEARSLYETKWRSRVAVLYGNNGESAKGAERHQELSATALPRVKANRTGGTSNSSTPAPSTAGKDPITICNEKVQRATFEYRSNNSVPEGPLKYAEIDDGELFIAVKMHATDPACKGIINIETVEATRKEYLRNRQAWARSAATLNAAPPPNPGGSSSANIRGGDCRENMPWLPLGTCQ